MALTSQWLITVTITAGLFASDAVPGSMYRSSQTTSINRATAEEQLSPEGALAMRAMVRESKLLDLIFPEFPDFRAAVTEFYDLNQQGLAWTIEKRPSPTALVLINELEHADAKGLEPVRYDSSRWRQRITKLERSHRTSELDLIRFDLALTVSALRYASDLSLGRANPRYVAFKSDLERKRCDLARILNRIRRANDVSSAFWELEPPFAAYRRTQSALNAYRSLAVRKGAGPLPQIRTIVKPGDRYPDLSQLARVLEQFGDLHEGETLPKSLVYEGALVEAVRRFQARHGLQNDGIITRHTIDELNVSLSYRIRQLQLTLERWRWIPHQFTQPPVIVNIPEFRLRALDYQNNLVLVSNVVVGKAYRHRTPVFIGQIEYVVFRPYWDVPRSVTRSELLPHIERNWEYLAQNGYEIVSNNGHLITDINDDVLTKLRSGQFRIRQRPGPNNALGLVKFVFPNNQDVYLHSTPAQDLFLKPRRDFSHGCIRVQNAEELAVWSLRFEPGWGVDRLRAAMNGNQTIRVNLRNPIPVLIVYGTALALADGRVYFFDDIYGYDAELERALAKEYGRSR